MRIRENFISDGLRWNVDGDKKLVQLWKKLRRTEEALREAYQANNILKQERKEEISGIEEFIANIRNLSNEKEALVESLEVENKKLASQIQQVCLERDAFAQESKDIAQLLLEEGLQQYSDASPTQQVQHLLHERSELHSSLSQAAAVVEERDKYRAELGANQASLQEVIEEVKELKARFISENRNHEIEKRKLSAELECK